MCVDVVFVDVCECGVDGRGVSLVRGVDGRGVCLVRCVVLMVVLCVWCAVCDCVVVVVVVVVVCGGGMEGGGGRGWGRVGIYTRRRESDREARGKETGQ